jgi:hypothetical protein
MVTYSFKERFVAPILAGTKRQTIRAHRVRHARPGEVIQLYRGLRTRQCYKIGAAMCAHALPISIYLGNKPIANRVVIDGSPVGDLDAFACRDGFSSWADLREFWKDTHDRVELFCGVIIQWTNFQSAVEAGRARQAP